MNKLKTIGEVILPMRVLNWIMGCGGVIEYPLDNCYLIFSLVYSTACTLCYCLLAYLCVDYNNKLKLEKNGDSELNDEILFKIFFYVNIFVTFATIFMGWNRGKGMKKSIQNIERVNEVLRKLGILDEHDKMYKKQLYYVMFTVTIITILVTINWINGFLMCPSCKYGIKLVFALKYHYPVSIVFITDFTFISYISIFRRKFEQLNDLLKTMSGASPLYPQYMKLIHSKTSLNETNFVNTGHKTNDDTQIMKAAKQAHLDLVKICKHVNRIFGLHLLLSMVLASFFITYLSYNAYTIYIYSHKETKVRDMIRSFNYLLFYILKILSVNHICDSTSQEALKTGSIICELHEPATSKEFRSEVQEFTLQLIQNSLAFTAYGFVTLDHTFIQGLVGTITTYLVILVQLRDMTESQ